MSRPLHILVADDDPAMCRFYEQFLPTIGHQVCVAQTGRQLVEQCRLLRPDLVISEVTLPDLDGIAATGEVCRAGPVPVILVSAHHDPSQVERAAPHVLAYFVKPVKEADLGTAVTLAGRHFDRLQSLHQEVAGLQQALEDRKLIERAKGVVMKYMALGEQEAYRRMRKMASGQNRKVVEVAQDVLAAGDVFQQMDDQQPQGEKPGNGHVRHAGKGEGTGPARTSAPASRNGPEADGT